MRIIVPIKQVPETKSVKMDEATGTVIRDGVESIINPLDLYAIEAAVRLRTRLGGEVVAITMGPPKAEEALREAIAMGADAAVLASDRTFAGADTWATSYVLAAMIREIGDYSLIICGERATDGDTGQVGPGIASFLDLPACTYISGIDGIEADTATVTRMVEDGYESLELSLPGLLTVVKELGEPRLPTLTGKKKARAAEIPVWDADRLALDASKLGLKGSPTKVVKIFRPKVARECEKFVGGDDEKNDLAAAATVKFLADKELI